MKPTIFDMETHRIKLGMDTPRLVCMSTAQPDGTTSLVAREEALDTLENYLDEGRLLANQNIFFDLKIACAEREHMIAKTFDAIGAGKIQDIIVRQQMIDNAAGELKYFWNDLKDQWEKQRAYSLDFLAQRHLGIDIRESKKDPNSWRLRFNELDGKPVSEYPPEAREYVIKDSTIVQGIWESQERKEKGLYNQESQVRAAWALQLMSTWGCRTDPMMVERYKQELTSAYNRQVEICQEYGLRRSTGQRNMAAIRDAVEEWYFDRGKKIKLTATGKVGTDREQLTGTDHPGLLAVAESVKVEKRLKTYIPALKRGTVVPLNARYNPILESYRTSCSSGARIDGEYPGMNLQNVPRGGMLRQCFIPRPGWVYAFCDYDTLEMRTLAQSCLDDFGFSHLAEAFKAGEDPHLSMAASVLGIDYAKALARLKAGDKDIKNARQYSKIANYGFGGGMGPTSFISYAKGYGIIVSKAKAEELHRGFRERWKEVVQYFNQISNLCDGGDIEELSDSRSGLIRGKVSYTQACNHGFQHPAACGAKEALWRVSYECYVDTSSPLYGCRPWLFCHDEIGMEIPERAFGRKRVHEAATRLQTVMVEAMKTQVPDVPIGATVALCRRWYKGAEPIFDNGMLAPSKPLIVDGKTKWVTDL